MSKLEIIMGAFVWLLAAYGLYKIVQAVTNAIPSKKTRKKKD